jgi:hypothetical protein
VTRRKFRAPYLLSRATCGATARRAARTLDAHACRLRHKLEQAGATGHVVNRRGIGYRLVDRVPETADGAPDDGQASGGGTLIDLVGRLDAA